MQLESLLGSKTKIKVLRKLANQSGWQFSISELARDLKLNKALISRTISELEKLNAVKVLWKGPVKLVSINNSNELIRSILSIFSEPTNFISKVCKEIVDEVSSKDIYSIILYGSVAKGTYTPSSDLDIMIVTKKKINLKEKLSKIAEKLGQSDIVLSYDIITKSELDRLKRQKVPMIVDMIKNHKILWGEEI